MKKKVLTVLTAGLLLAVVLAGCKNSTAGMEIKNVETISEIVSVEEQSDIQAVPSTETSTGNVSVDRAGNEIVIPEEVEKIVSMSPSTTEILIDLGLADKIIACDTYSGFSPFASNLNEGIPQFDMMAPDCESIVALKPDVVFTTGMSYAGGDDVYATVKSSGICVADIPSAASIEDIKKDIAFFGEVTKTSDKANEIIAQMDDYVSVLENVAKGISEKKKVLYVMSVPTADYPDVYTCGKGTYMDEIFALCGLENIAGDIDFEWPALSEEDIVADNPDVIIVGDNYTPDAVNAVLSIATWKDLNAVKNKEVYLIDGDAFNQPNQYVLNSAYEIFACSYPDLAKDLSKPFE